MTGYIIRRFLAMIPVLIVVELIAFSLIHIVPGDPVAMMLGSEEARLDDIVRVRRELGLDRPFLQQLLSWVGNTLKGDLGNTLFQTRPVTQALASALPPTLSLAIMGQVLATILGVSMGVLAAWYSHTWVDRATMVFAVLGFSTPVFWVAIMLMYLFGGWLGWLPVVGYSPMSDGIWPWLSHLILPALAVGVINAAIIARMTRSSMLEVLRNDYVRTARAKGLPENVVLIRHALRNAFNPILTVVGLSFAGVVTGLIVTETMFAIPGVGRLAVVALFQRDYPLIQGIILYVAIGFVMVNLIVDLLYGFFDPRIRYA